jgi:hypothetical protein
MKCHPTEGPLSNYMGPDRRNKPRIYSSFLVKVRGVDAFSQAFEVEALLENLSVGGLYLRMPRDVDPGECLFILVIFPKLGSEGGAARVAIRGLVVRSEPQPDGRYGLAIAIRQHRFLSAEKLAAKL